MTGKMLGALEKLRKAANSFVISICPSVRPSTWKDTAPTGQIFMKFDICIFLENMSRKIRDELKPNNNGHFTYRTIERN